MTTKDEYLGEVARCEELARMEPEALSATVSAEWKHNLIGKNGVWLSRQHNYGLIAAHDDNLRGRFKYDTFKNQIMVEGSLPFGSFDQRVPLTDNMLTRTQEYVGAVYGIDNEKMLRKAICVAAEDNSFDSLLDMLDNLEWDGMPRIETMLSKVLGAEDSDYTRETAKLMMRGAVCRAYRPGTQFDFVTVLVGKQGCRKSSFCRALAMSPEFFEDNLGNLSKPDAARKLQGVLVVEMAELASFKTTTKHEAIRSFITSTHDSYRRLYQEDMVKLPRRCIFLGTTNDYTFLNDPTGSRRYLPVEVGLYETRFDWTSDEAVSEFFQQVWAEAVSWYKDNPDGIGKTLVLPESVMDELAGQRARFKEEDPWLPDIRKYLDEHEGQEVCSKELLIKALNMDDKDKEARANMNRIVQLVRSSCEGWEVISGKSKRLGEYGPQTRYFVKRETL